MNVSTLLARSRDLLQRALATDALHHRDPYKAGTMWIERREALEVIEELLAFSESQTREFIGLEARVYELAGLAVRGEIGQKSWRDAFPDKANATPFYQALKSLAKWCESRVTAGQSDENLS